MLLCEAIAKGEKWRKELEQAGNKECFMLADSETIKQFLDLSLWALKKAKEEDKCV